MPRGPRGEWRPTDPIAQAVHVMEVATGLREESTEPPADYRKPKPPTVAASSKGGRSRAAKLDASERTASAKRASDARWRKGATA